MADGVLLLILVLMSLLLMAFAWQIFTTDSADGAAARTPALAPLPELLVSVDDATDVLWVNEILRPEVSGVPPWDLRPEQQVVGRPGVSGGPPWGPAPKPRGYPVWPRRYLHLKGYRPRGPARRATAPPPGLGWPSHHDRTPEFSRVSPAPDPPADRPRSAAAAQDTTTQPEPPATDDTADPVRDEMADAATSTTMGEWIFRAWLAVAIVGLWAVAAYILAAPRHAVTAAPSARPHPVAHSHPGQHRHAPSAAAAVPTLATVPARTLTPVRAIAFGPSAASPGDNGDLAFLAIDANPATAWHTDWYTTALFGNLYPGTGLLVDMGRSVTVTAAQITLGSAHGASLQLRVGAAPVLADLPLAAHAANAGGVVRLRLTSPAHGRYVLIWFTLLPPDPAGTYQASVYNLQLQGRT